MTMHPTKNDLNEKTRTQMVDLLQKRLADAIDLMLQAKQAHWNVKGPHFMSLHELFDKVFETTEGHVDMLAERMMQLGGKAQGTVRTAAKQSMLAEYPLNITDGKDHVEALSSALASFGKGTRAAIDLATECKDAGTADLFTEISRENDQNLWFVESHRG